jgi:pimeloyl-CoA synthetase
VLRHSRALAEDVLADRAPLDAAIKAYCRLRDDREGEVDFAEIRLRAIRRIGELSRELEISDQARGGRHPTVGKLTKSDALTEAGLTRSTATRYEELASGGQVRGRVLTRSTCRVS